MSTGDVFVCPNCGSNFPFNASLAGRRVKCPACHQSFVAQSAHKEPTEEPPVAQASTPPPPPAPPPPKIAKSNQAADSASDPGLAEQFTPEQHSEPRFRRVLHRMLPLWTFVSRKGSDLWTFFDFGLERYVTPHIVQICWILALAFVLFYGIVMTWQVVIPQRTSASQSVNSAEEERVRMYGKVVPRKSNMESAFEAAYDTFTTLFVGPIRVVCLVLLVRVVCELLVVAFNIANSLKSIDVGVAKLGRA